MDGQLIPIGASFLFHYLAHPLAINLLDALFHRAGLVLTVPLILLFYAMAAAVTVLFAIAVRRLGSRLPLLNLLTIGGKR